MATCKNYTKLLKLLEKANQCIRKAFVKEWEDKYEERWQDGRPSAKFFEFIDRIPYASEFQIGLLKYGNSKDWDVSLFFFIFSTPPINKFFRFVKDIKDVRNILFHRAHPSFEDKELLEILKILKPAFEGIGKKDEEIDDLIDSISFELETERRTLESYSIFNDQNYTMADKALAQKLYSMMANLN